jgi:hypothetical protein
MTESDKLKLEETHILIDSIHWPEVIYAISKDHKSMYVRYGHKQELPLWGDQVKAFTTELLKVWEHIGR